MRIRIFDSKEECFEAAASVWVNYAIAHPTSIIGCCTGTTTGPIHQLVVEKYKKSPFDTSNLRTANVDQFVTPNPCPKKLTMYHSMRPLYEGLGLDEEHGMLPSCTPEDPDAECEKYERKIQMLGGIGLQELGIGSDAHIGFCLPGTPFGKGMHVTRVSDKIVEDIRTAPQHGVDPSYGPFYGMTMGLKTVMHARFTFPITVGASKAQATYNAILGPVTEDVPASILQMHPNGLWYMDREAAEGIIGRVNPDGTIIK